MNKITIRTGYDKYSNKCVDISFSTSSNIKFDIQLGNRKSVQEQVGDWKNPATLIIYTHPTTSTEQDIIMSFTSLKVNDNLNCDIEF